eukprot:scaffold444613_cov16-Prasinocladus_malaysianus.AAC.1
MALEATNWGHHSMGRPKQQQQHQQQEEQQHHHQLRPGQVIQSLLEMVTKSQLIVSAGWSHLNVWRARRHHPT